MKKYTETCAAYGKINKVGLNTNHGHFEIWQETRKGDPNVITSLRSGRDVDCSQHANYMGAISSGSGKFPVATMFIPLKFWGENLKKEEVEGIVTDLKNWVRLGRECFIRGTFRGVMSSEEYFKGKSISPSYVLGAKGTQCLVVDWDCGDLCSSRHGLATFSFFRYFYSSYSNHIYETTMRLKTKYPTLPEKVCLWVSHMVNQNSDYDPYFGLYDMPTSRQDADDDDQSPSTIWKIPNSFSLRKRYLLGESINRTWSSPITNLKTKEINREEYEKLHKRKISDSLWTSVTKWKENHVRVVQSSDGSIKLVNTFYTELQAEDENNTLEKFITPYLSGFYEEFT